MSPAEADDEPPLRLIAELLPRPDFRRAMFGGVRRRPGDSPWLRAEIRPIELRGDRQLQFSYFDAKKNIVKNHRLDDIHAPLAELLALGFAGIHVSTTVEEVDIQTTKKGKTIIGRKRVDARPEPVAAHNRVKNAPLAEDRPDRLLEVMGIQTRDGRIRPTMRAKFTQINEFLRQLTHAIDEAELRTLGRELEILDCGCGSSHLTLAAHHYLNAILGIGARLIGVDINEELIRKSVARSEMIGAEKLAFACGRIDAAGTRPDIVLALHACDTATDDAIAHAVRREAKIVLAVPCCHHHLNDRIQEVGLASPLRPIFRHGILHERAADLATDAFRAAALRVMGYRTEVIEFISPEHTARNLMIRSIRGGETGRADAVAEYVEMRRFWNVEPYIEKALGESFQHIVGRLS